MYMTPHYKIMYVTITCQKKNLASWEMYQGMQLLYLI